MKHRLDLSVLTLLFFTWGFVTCLNDILIPHFKAGFSLTYFQAALIQFTFFFAYFVLALPSGALINRVGYQKTMVLGLVIAAIGAFAFIPAAKAASYGFFLAALFTLASGITLLQVSANPYVNAIGPEATSASRLNLTQAFNSLGTTVAPLIGGYLILSQTGSIEAVVGPYLFLTAVLLSLAVLFHFYKLPLLPAVESVGGGHRISEVFRFRHTVLGAVGIFVYVGAEVSIGSFLVNYIEEQNLGLSTETAAHYVAFYWGGAMVGRFLGAGVLQRVPASKVVAGCALMAGLLTALSTVGVGWVAVWGLLAVGLFNSVLFPSVFSLGIARLGTWTSAGSSLLIMAIVGGAILPLGMGALADSWSLNRAMILPAACYVYLVYYGAVGSRVLRSGIEGEVSA